MGGGTCAAGPARPAWLCLRIRASAAIPGACGRQVAPEENEVGAVFTGIVEELGEGVALEELGGSARLTVRGPLVTAGATPGCTDAPTHPRLADPPTPPCAIPDPVA